MLVRRTPSNTYTSRRRQRSASNPYPHLIPSSSPIKQLNQDDEDLSVGEMSRRMQKRSRVSMKRSIPGSALVKSASVGTSPLDGIHDEAPPSKKKRTGTREPLATLKAPGSNTQEATTDNDEILDMDITSIAQLKTPVPRENIIEPGKPDTVADEEADSLSPLPTSLKAKRVIAHRSNSNLKENSNRNMIAKGGNPLATSLLDDLDSPFHSRPGSPNTSRPPLSKSWNKSLNRTRSVGTDLRRRATLRSHSRAVSPASNTSSPGTRRHPSQPTSRMNLRQENKAWLVPAQFKPGIGQKTPRRPSDAAIPFIRESSFFESTPDACSTPLNKQNGSRLTGCYIDIDATPRLPLTLRPTTPVNKQDFCGIDDPTPRASIVNGPSIYSKDSLISSVHSEKDANDGHSHSTKVASERMRRRVAVHYSQDSIFSSALDFSMTAPNLLLPDVLTPPKNADVTVAPPSSPAPVSRKTSPASLGDDLRDMFSTLGLNGTIQSLENND